jgi:hypothetical protein
MLFASLGHAQVWYGFGNTIQWQKRGDDTLRRIGGGSGPNAYIGFYDRYQIDKFINARPSLPIGLSGQTLAASGNNSNNYLPVEPLVYGQFIYTDSQKDSAFASGSATQLQIFNSFKRFAHGGSPSSSGGILINGQMPVRVDATNSWIFDTVTNAVKSTLNTGSFVGFISPKGFSNYVHTLTLSAASGDNDFIGTVIAFMEDSLHMIPNQAYGLDPNTYKVNVTDSLIPRQHTLTLIRERQNVSKSYIVYYDYNLPTQRTIVNGSAGVYQTTAAWSGVTVDVSVVRRGDTITANTTNYSDAPGGKGSMSHPLTFNLASDTSLIKFRGAKPYGYAAWSQDNATFTNINFSGSDNLIFDLRNGNTYKFTDLGYILDTTKNSYRDLGVRYFWRNKMFRTFGYILPDNTFDVIVGPQP